MPVPDTVRTLYNTVEHHGIVGGVLGHYTGPRVSKPRLCCSWRPRQPTYRTLGVCCGRVRPTSNSHRHRGSCHLLYGPRGLSTGSAVADRTLLQSGLSLPSGTRFFASQNCVHLSNGRSPSHPMRAGLRHRTRTRRTHITGDSREIRRTHTVIEWFWLVWA